MKMCKDCKVRVCNFRNSSATCFFQEGLKEYEEPVIEFDWASFRREAAMRMLPITSEWRLSKKDVTVGIPKEAACKLAIEYADELIKQLKEESK